MKRMLSCTDHVSAKETNAGNMTILFSIFTFLTFFMNQIAFMSQRGTQL